MLTCMMNREIIYTDDFVRSAADRIVWTIEKELAQKEYFCLSLCGGSTPFPVYARIAQDGRRLPWDKVIVTFGDERCVPPSDEQSNFRAARLNFFDRVPIPAANILRIRGEEAPIEAANDYESQLDAVAARCGMKTFVHDLVLLGMGDDGHTASLFPGTEALRVVNRRVVANYVPKLNANRISFTYPFINDSERVMFLVNDRKKKRVLEEVLEGKGSYPAIGVRPRGDLVWMLGGLLDSPSSQSFQKQGS